MSESLSGKSVKIMILTMALLKTAVNCDDVAIEITTFKLKLMALRVYISVF